MELAIVRFMEDLRDSVALLAYRFARSESDEQRELREAREHLQRVLDLRKSIYRHDFNGTRAEKAVERETNEALGRYADAVEAAERAEVSP